MARNDIASRNKELYQETTPRDDVSHTDPNFVPNGASEPCFTASSESWLPNAIVSLYYATAFDVVFKFSCVNCLFRRIAVSTPVTRNQKVAAVVAGDDF